MSQRTLLSKFSKDLTTYTGMFLPLILIYLKFREREIIHTDLKPENVMLGKALCPRSYDIEKVIRNSYKKGPEKEKILNDYRGIGQFLKQDCMSISPPKTIYTNSNSKNKVLF